MSDIEKDIDENSGSEKEEFSLPTSNDPNVSNHSPQVSISNYVLPVTKDDINIGDWLLIHLPYFTTDKAQSTSRAFSKYYIAQVVGSVN